MTHKFIGPLRIRTTEQLFFVNISNAVGNSKIKEYLFFFRLYSDGRYQSFNFDIILKKVTTWE